MFLTTPFMVAVQIVSARIGSVTGSGLAANLGEVLPPALLYGIVALTAAANTVNIAADIAAMGEAVRLVGGPAVVYALTLGGICAAAQIVIPYRPYARYMKVLTLVLFAYVAAAFSLRLPWGEVLASTFIPRLSWQRDFVVMVVAVLGTTISPYLFFWQVSLEVEERRVMERKKEAPLQNGNASARRRFEPIVIDTWTGMALSNIVGFFIIVTTAATLHAHGIDKIGTAADAAEALRPAAGRAAFLLFSLGIVGTGLLAIPALAGSAAYAIAETFGWKGSLGLRPQRALRSISSSAARPWWLARRHDSDQSDHDAGLECGVQRHRGRPLMVGMMLVVTNRKIMGKFAASRVLATFGWLATLLMGVVVAALLVTTLTG
jgi:Mn2+/Fe2+ NRAMP family transporter